MKCIHLQGFSAISGKDGSLLWEFDDQNAKIDTSNVYNPQYLMDIDFDGIPDLLVIHGGDPLKERGWYILNYFIEVLFYIKLEYN